MTRILVAGIGNVFFSDDGFGVAVADRLAREALPDGVRVADFGIRSVHLAFELLDPPELLVLVDATPRGGAPGTLYLIDPEVEAQPPAEADAHAMDAAAVLAAARRLSGRLPTTRIVGCEPADVGEGMDLSQPVRDAITPAIAMIRRLIEQSREEVTP